MMPRMQESLSVLEYAAKKRRTRRGRFLGEIEAVLWDEGAHRRRCRLGAHLRRDADGDADPLPFQILRSGTPCSHFGLLCNSLLLGSDAFLALIAGRVDVGGYSHFAHQRTSHF